MINFPYTNFHRLNLDWLMKAVEKLVEDVKKIPTKTSQLINDSGFVNSAAAAAAAPVQSVNGMTGDVIVPGGGGGAVDSVNGQTGVVVLTASDVGAKPASYEAPVQSVNGATGAVTIDIPQASTTNPVMDGTVAIGTSTNYARADHRHPKDTSKANLASPTFTGTPKAPTAAAGTNTTQLATTGFVQQELLAAGVLSASTAETMSTPEQTTSNLKLNMNFTKLGRFVMVQVAITVTGNLSTGDYTFPTLDTTSWPLRFRPIAQARQTTTRWPIALQGFGSLRISPGSTGNVMYQCGQAISATGETYINANLTYISAE